MRWISTELAILMHRELIREHGGEAGIRDPGLLESALARPLNLHAYENADVHRLAAAYAYGIAQNHPFIDGNKRMALMTLYTFLRINGVLLTASEEDAVYTMMLLAEGKIAEDELTAWIREHACVL